MRVLCLVQCCVFFFFLLSCVLQNAPIFETSFSFSFSFSCSVIFPKRNCGLEEHTRRVNSEACLGTGMEVSSCVPHHAFHSLVAHLHIR